MKALIVDDSMVTRNIIKKFVKSMGYDALEAGNGKLALVRWSPKTGQCAKLWVTP
jgi:CheY-like chemotaxis protein